VESWLGPEFQTARIAHNHAGVEFGFAAKDVNKIPVEAFGSTLSDISNRIEYLYIARQNTTLSAEALGAVTLTADALLPLEDVVLRPFNSISQTESGSRIFGTTALSTESPAKRTVDTWVTIDYLTKLRSDLDIRSELAVRLADDPGAPIEILTALSREAPPAVESLSAGARVTTATLLALEWADPPALLIVSQERMLRSPGKIRILAGPASVHPLRGQ
jgi:hypothetical protein